jgi:[FeFe] hydrogenase H-cluster maturation GTPase HydF
LKVLEKTDLALLVVEPLESLQDCEKELVSKLKKKKVNFIVVVNKCEECEIPESLKQELVKSGAGFTSVSALTKKGIEELKSTKIQKALKDFDTGTIIGDIVQPGQVVVLVVPIDLAAPKGRLILPQVQTIRDLLDTDAIAVIAKERELKAALDSLKVPPALVITDSQAFLKVAADVPEGVSFTSFSVIFARYKGDLGAYVDGIRKLEKMDNKGKILIAESCTHHQMADDIGRVKIPRWVRQNYGGKIEFDFCQGVNFPENLKEYDLVVQCGGCMTNRKAILSRIEACRKAGVAITNYGIIIAHLHGVLEDALKPFGIILDE